MSWKSALAEAVPGELAERPFGRARLRQDLGLDHHLSVRGDQHVGRLALHQFERLAEEPAHDRALVLVDRADRETAERDGGMTADRERHGQRLVARLREALILPEVLAERQVDRRRIAALDHQPVVGAVPHLLRRVLRERDGGGEVGARVTLVVEDLRQRVEIDLVALEDDFLHRPGRHDARRDRLLHRLAISLQHPVGRGADRGGETRAARVEVRDDRELRSLHVFEDQDRAALQLALELHDERGDLVGGVDFLLQDLDVVRLRALDLLEEAPQVLGHGYVNP